MVIFAPACPRASAIARPIRLAPPVTSADFPVSTRSELMPASMGLGRRLRFISRLGVVLGLVVILVFVLALTLRVGLVDRVLLARAPHANFDGQLALVDLVIPPVSLEALRDDLQPHRLPHLENIDKRFTILIGLELHIALFFQGMEDHGSILDGLAVFIAQD